MWGWSASTIKISAYPSWWVTSYCQTQGHLLCNDGASATMDTQRGFPWCTCLIIYPHSWRHHLSFYFLFLFFCWYYLFVFSKDSRYSLISWKVGRLNGEDATHREAKAIIASASALHMVLDSSILTYTETALLWKKKVKESKETEGIPWWWLQTLQGRIHSSCRLAAYLLSLFHKESTHN